MKKVANTLKTLGLVGCAVINSPFAMADDVGWYVGGNIGQSRAKIDDVRITSSLLGGKFTTTSIIDDNHDTGYKLFGGYQFNKNFSVEAGYFDLGQFGYTATVTTPLPATPGTLTGQIRLKGINIDAVGILPITENFSAFGRVGLNYAQARDSFTGTGSVTVLNPTPNKNDTNLKLGLGIGYDFTKSLGMRAEVERYRINDAVGNRGDIDVISLGLIYRFGVKKPAPAPLAAAPAYVAPAPTPLPAPVLVSKEVVAKLPPPPPAPVPAPRKVTFSADSSADSLFGFDKFAVSPAGKQAIDKFVADLRGATFSVITVTGHTDRIGSHAYNQKLSERRAESVKAYLVESAGIPSDRITAKGAGESEPMTKPGECKNNKGHKTTKELIACLAPDRRVDVEVVATRSSN